MKGSLEINFFSRYCQVFIFPAIWRTAILSHNLQNGLRKTMELTIMRTLQKDWRGCHPKNVNKTKFHERSIWILNCTHFTSNYIFFACYMIPYSRRTNLCCRTKYIVKGKICFFKNDGAGFFKKGAGSVKSQSHYLKVKDVKIKNLLPQ